MIPNGDAWGWPSWPASPTNDEPAWIDAYASTIGNCKLTPEQAMQAARDAYLRESWNNPKVAAGKDAVFGPMQ